MAKNFSALILFFTAACFGADAQPPQTDAPSTQHKETRASLLQGGPWFSWAANPEQPFVNLLAADGPPWVQYDDTWAIAQTAADLTARGLIDPETGLPAPTTETIDGPFLFGGPGAAQFDGEWVLEWEGEADFFLQFQPKNLQWREGNRIAFTRDKAGGRTPDHVWLRVKNIKTPISSVTLYRAEDEAAARAGAVWRPGFLSLLDGYDIVRTMDMQRTNSMKITRADEVPFTNYMWNGESAGAKYEGPPLERLLDLGPLTGASLWMQAPAHLGFPGEPPEDHTAASKIGKDNAVAIINSPEWDRFADRLVAALQASDYPADRTLYLSYANEVWNWVFGNTTYVNGVGAGLTGEDYAFRKAYGALLVRVMTATEAALARAGRTQKVVYVLEGQAGWADLTAQALKGAKDWTTANGHDWNALAPLMGVSVASYWGVSAESLAKAGVDPNDLPALEAYFLNANKDAEGSVANVTKLWRDNAKIAGEYGVRFIGAYEGGSHFIRPANMTQENYTAFVWGEAGGRVNTAVNDALAAEFPGAILSNYALCGPIGGQPWFDGECGGSGNPYAASWKEYKQKK